MSDIKTIILTGKVLWAKVHSPVKNFAGDGEEFSIDVEVSDEKLKDLYALGMSTKRKAKEIEGKKFITFKKPTVSKAGKALIPPVVLNKDDVPLEDLIGNGSTASVKIVAFPYSNKFGTGVVLRLDAVKVLDLIRYEPKKSDSFSDVDSTDSFI